MIALAAEAAAPDAVAMKRFAALVLGAGAAMLALSVSTQQPLIIYNRSPSVPVGYYVRTGASPMRGSFVTVSAAKVAPDYARARNYADASDRFIKRVAAIAGDEVCAEGVRVQIGEVSIPRRAADRAGVPLPLWSGCRTLEPGEVFLLGDSDDSFDGRYWGPVEHGEIDGVWRPL